MVAVLVRLKLTLVVNGYRRSVWQTVGLVVAALYALSVVAMVAVASIGLSTLDAEVSSRWLVLGGAVLVVGWWFLPLMSFGLDATLDPRRFQLFALPRRDLVLGLALGAMIGVPGVATLLAALSTSLAWWRHPLAFVVAIVGAVLGVAVCVVGSRAVAAVVAPLLEWRRVREVALVAAVVVIVLALQLVSRIIDAVRSADDVLPSVAGVLGWTPFGAPWALAGDVVAGSWVALLGRLVLTGATLVVLLVAWDAALARTLVRAPSRGPVATAQGLGWFARFGSTPVGAVAARCLTYWQRDPRYAGSIAFLPFVPIPFLVTGGLEGNTSLLWVAPLVAYVMGFAISADVGYDYTAFWLHVAAGVRGASDRAGRVVPAVMIAVPLVVLLAVGAAWATHRWSDLPAVLGASLGILMTALGASSVLSAYYLYPVPKPGEGMFTQPQGAGVAIAVGQTIGLVTTALLSLPTVALLVVALVTGAAWASVATVVVGLAAGAAALVAGIRIGGAALDRSGPELLQRMAAWS